MKKFLLFACCVAALASCTPSVPQTEYDALKAQRDSIQAANDNMTEVIGTIAGAMNEMANDEGLLFVDDNGNDLKDKSAVLNRMKTLREHMADQRAKLDELEKKAQKLGGSNAYLNKLIKEYKAQIEEKDAKIAELESALADKNASIDDLKGKLAFETAAKEKAEEARDHYIEVAQNQDIELNTAYYIVDTKSNLKAAGLMEGVFKKRANYANLDNTKFNKVDVRDFTSLVIESKKPKLITEKPASSYNLEVNADGTTTLNITDPANFWAASPYLIIQK